MSLPLSIHPLAEAEAGDAFRWYERRQSGLGDDSLDELGRVLTAVEASPQRYAIADGDIREAMLARFPYTVYFRVLADRIRVLAVHHASRDPARWQART